MNIKLVLAAMGLALVMNVHADDADVSHSIERLITPTLWAISDGSDNGTEGDDWVACNLTNVAQQTRTARVRIISDGLILLDSGPISIEPLHTANHFVDAAFEDGGPIYCEFTIQGPKDAYRGAVKLFHAPNSSDFAALPAS